MMKTKIIKGIALFCFILLIFVLCGKIERTYTTNGTIVSNSNNTLTIKDITGKTWNYTSKEKITTPNVKIWFDDNGTKERDDDKIIKIKNTPWHRKSFSSIIEESKEGIKMFEKILVENMRDEVIKNLGLEDSKTIYFCTMVEGYEKGILDSNFIIQTYLKFICK